MVEVEPVHLGADQVMVDLLGDGPVVDLDRGQPRLVVLEALALPLHRLGRVVGHAAHDLGLLEDAEVLEELQQVGVGAGRGVLSGRRGRSAGDRQCEQGGQWSEAQLEMPHHGSSFRHSGILTSV